MTVGNEAAGATAHRETNADGAQNSTGSWAIIGAIILLLVYQGYTLSVSGIASPWIAKSFHLSQPALARLRAPLACCSWTPHDPSYDRLRRGACGRPDGLALVNVVSLKLSRAHINPR